MRPRASLVFVVGAMLPLLGARADQLQELQKQRQRNEREFHRLLDPSLANWLLRASPA